MNGDDGYKMYYIILLCTVYDNYEALTEKVVCVCINNCIDWIGYKYNHQKTKHSQRLNTSVSSQQAKSTFFIRR